jgi:hypothetical protein
VQAGWALPIDANNRSEKELIKIPFIAIDFMRAPSKLYWQDILS